MDKKIAGLLGALAGLATAGGAQAAINPAATSPQALQVTSYADLLAPIANPVDLLRAVDASQPPEPRPAADFQLAAYHDHHYRYSEHRSNAHHHHHHARVYHHHHHHHNHAFFGIPGLGGVVLNGR
jgi:hypothetical protein